MIANYAPILGGVATIIAALITVVGGSIVYRHQRNIDWRNRLREERRQVYAATICSLKDLTFSKVRRAESNRIDEKSLSDAMGQIALLALYADDKIVSQASRCLDGIISDNPASNSDKKISLREFAQELRLAL